MMMMQMMITLLLGEMLFLNVMLASPMGRIRVVDHVDADAARLTSPHLGEVAL